MDITCCIPGGLLDKKDYSIITDACFLGVSLRWLFECIMFWTVIITESIYYIDWNILTFPSCEFIYCVCSLSSHIPIPSPASMTNDIQSQDSWAPTLIFHFSEVVFSSRYVSPTPEICPLPAASLPLNMPHLPLIVGRNKSILLLLLFLSFHFSVTQDDPRVLKIYSISKSKMS